MAQDGVAIVPPNGRAHVGLLSDAELRRFQEAGPRTGASEPAGSAPWMPIAHREAGVRDFPGPRYHPRVVEYLDTVGFGQNADETSWCSAFVNWCVAQAGLPGTGKANARSWLDWGRELSEPRPGCIVVLWREAPSSWKGHVGFFDGWDLGDRVRLFAGNQGGGVDWDEVCLATFPKARILGYRWPKSDAA